MLDKAVALWAAGLVFAMASCVENTPCDEALEKMVNECELGSAAELPIGGGNRECIDDGGINQECGAECVNDADCDELVDPMGDTGYHRCVADCNARP
jgi:hypothetical protein